MNVKKKWIIYQILVWIDCDAFHVLWKVGKARIRNSTPTDTWNWFNAVGPLPETSRSIVRSGQELLLNVIITWNSAKSNTLSIHSRYDSRLGNPIYCIAGYMKSKATEEFVLPKHSADCAPCKCIIIMALKKFVIDWSIDSAYHL